MTVALIYTGHKGMQSCNINHVEGAEDKAKSGVGNSTLELTYLHSSLVTYRTYSRWCGNSPPLEITDPPTTI